MILTEDFYKQPAEAAAKALLGKVLVTSAGEGVTKGIIVETEAYIGPEDMAAHTAGGRRTARNEAMYRPGGCVYVYTIYGMHTCFNVVTGPEDSGQAVLVRALEPLEGMELMRKRRGVSDIKNLASGPGKLCAAMGIDKSFYGESLTGNRIRIEDAGASPEIIASKRINVDYAGEWADKLLRFTIKDSPFVSVRCFMV
ncbi:MAG: DNA-3-methyladenine glycosylase [Abditibacteriota bacterium]|nr:DNA-3-methyladenine glycosylase [Abditibacteriota bacterium]